jgi:hypothetical protein
MQGSQGGDVRLIAASDSAASQSVAAGRAVGRGFIGSHLGGASRSIGATLWRGAGGIHQHGGSGPVAASHGSAGRHHGGASLSAGRAAANIIVAASHGAAGSHHGGTSLSAGRAAESPSSHHHGG